MKYWVFDLDGTLVDSFAKFFSTLEDQLARPLTPAERKRFIGIPPQQIYAETLGTEKIESSFEELRKRSRIDALKIRQFRQMNESLKELSKRKKRVAIWTARDRDSASMIVKNSGLGAYAERLITGDCVSKGKPDPEGLKKLSQHFACKPSEMVMVGDHDHDIEAAREFGAYAVRASWHPHWEHAKCELSNRQFSCRKEFRDWIKSL